MALELMIVVEDDGRWNAPRVAEALRRHAVFLDECRKAQNGPDAVGCQDFPDLGVSLSWAVVEEQPKPKGVDKALWRF
jgi:hypothetical protein